MKKGTKTSSFGVSKRERHDSSQFYNSKLYDGLNVDENPELIDNSSKIDPSMYGRRSKVDDGSISSLPDSSVHLVLCVITELRKEDIAKDSPFFKTLETLFDLIKVKMASGGRIALLVDNTLTDSNNLKTYYPVHQIMNSVCQGRGLLMRGEIILLTSPRDSENSPIESQISNEELASLQQRYSRALIYSKQLYARKKKQDDVVKLSDSIDRDGFLESTKSVWSNPSSDLNTDFRLYLKRICELYSFVEDTVLIVSRQTLDLDGVRKKIIYASI